MLQRLDRYRCRIDGGKFDFRHLWGIFNGILSVCSPTCLLNSGDCFQLWYTLNIHIRHKPTVVIESLTANAILLTLYPIVGLAVGNRIDNPGLRGAFQSGLVLIGGVSSVLIYLLPKVFTLDQEEDKLDSAAENTLCPTCHGTGNFGDPGSTSVLAINEIPRKSLIPESDELPKTKQENAGNISIAILEKKPTTDFEDRIEKGNGEGAVG